MRSTKKTAWLAGIALAASLSLAGCGDDGSTESDDAIKIGFINVTTGPAAAYGAPANQGVQAAVTKINADGGVLGRKLVIDEQDSAFDPAQAISLLRRFAGDDNYDAIIGPITSSETVAVLPIATSLKVPVVNISQVGLDDDAFPEGFVRVNLVNNPTTVNSFFDQVENAGIELGSVAIMVDRTNENLAETAKVVEGVLETRGMPLADKESFSAGDTDFSSQLDSILREGPPEAIWLNAVTADAALIIQQARERGFTGRFLGEAGIADPKLIELAGTDAEGTLVMSSLSLEGNDSQVAQDFASEMKSQYDLEPTDIAPYGAFGYDALLVLADAIERANSTDRDKVVEALGKTTGLELVTGSYTYDGGGDNQNPVPYVLQAVDSKFVALKAQ